MSAPYPERKWKDPVVSSLPVTHCETPYFPATPEEAAAYMADTLLPAEVCCYTGEHRQKVALDIARQIFVAAVDIHDLVEAWQRDQAPFCPSVPTFATATALV